MITKENAIIIENEEDKSPEEELIDDILQIICVDYPIFVNIFL